MERTAYELLKRMERSWWYTGRSFAVRAALARAGVKRCATALDYGAGYGGMQATLANFADRVDAFEPDTEAARAASSRGYTSVFTDETAAFANTCNLIGLFDVLEHIENDEAFLVRAQVALAPGGHIVFTVPAYMMLWSAHDVEHHHFRRYTVRSLRDKLEKAGYNVDYASYWNASLLLPAALLRLLGKSGEGGLSPHPVLNSMLMLVVRIEAAVLRFLPLPFGLSIVLVACKK